MNGSLQLIQSDPNIAATATGHVGVSTDGVGSTYEHFSDTTSIGTLFMDLPSGATIEKAFLHVVTTSHFGNYQIGKVRFDGSTIDLTWLPNIADNASLFFETGVADVTANVAAAWDEGRAQFDVDENVEGLADFSYLVQGHTVGNTVEGASLTVIYSHPDMPESSIFVLHGGLTGPTPQTNTVRLNQPIDKSQLDFNASLALGIQFSANSAENRQFSTVAVNGVQLTGSAGHYDDGLLANGALITVGGVGDGRTNPVNSQSHDPELDDELYDLRPFLRNGDTEIEFVTANPSDDDSIFLLVMAITGDGDLTEQDALGIDRWTATAGGAPVSTEWAVNVDTPGQYLFQLGGIGNDPSDEWTLDSATVTVNDGVSQALFATFVADHPQQTDGPLRLADGCTQSICLQPQYHLRMANPFPVVRNLWSTSRHLSIRKQTNGTPSHSMSRHCSLHYSALSPCFLTVQFGSTAMSALTRLSSVSMPGTLATLAVREMA